jgi:hypothetical protein
MQVQVSLTMEIEASADISEMDSRSKKEVSRRCARR